jgi:hypothetical protein
MKAGIVAFALATLAFTGIALAEKPVVKPYAAGAPYGGIPIWSPGEKFIGVSGGTCSGNCPVYELYLFDDGRVVFNGRKGTKKVGVWNKKVAPEVYAELLTTLVRTKVLDEEIKRGTCLKGRSMLIVMARVGCRGCAHGGANSGCEARSGQADRGTIEFTGVASWLAPPK